MFARRTEWPSHPNRLTQKLSALREAGRPVLDLTESNPTRCAFQYPAEFLKTFDDPKNLTYDPSPRGLLKARKSVAGYYRTKGISVDPEHIILTASTSEAYSFLFRLLLNPGEKILVPRPSYPLFEYLASLDDVAIDSYPLSYGERWEIDLKTVKEKISPETKALVLVHPNNPTGSFVKKEEKEHLISIAKEKNLALICDEVFLDYPYPENTAHAISFAGEKNALTFTLSGISKVLALPQMKLGWIVVNGSDKLRDASIERLELISDTYLSVNTPVQQALDAWFSFRPALQDQVRKRILMNREFLLKKCRTENADLLNGEGGWYAILRLPGAEDEEKWVLGLLERQSVLIHPGYFYDFFEEGRFGVVSLLLPTEQFRGGVDRLFNYRPIKHLHKFKRHNI